ncbi:MAG TPA: DUF4342 domain-containing protein [Actinomycetota bacterium]|nr:DUF4342 domain-containing protein [Actinomycetota bacterium]
MSDEKVWTEELRVRGDALVAKIRELVREGNVRRIIIKDSEGRSMIEIPLTLGVVGALVAPVWAAIGAIAALAADWSIVVERRESPGTSEAKRSGGSSRGKAG